MIIKKKAANLINQCIHKQVRLAQQPCNKFSSRSNNDGGWPSSSGAPQMQVQLANKGNQFDRNQQSSSSPFNVRINGAPNNINKEREDANNNVEFNNQPEQNKSFTSKYYDIKTQEIHEFLQLYKIRYQLQGSEIVIYTCPLCMKPHNNDPKNMNTCRINAIKGFFNCFRCGSSGSWYGFKNKILHNHFGTSPEDLVFKADQSPGTKQFTEGFQFKQDWLPDYSQRNQDRYEIEDAHKVFIQLKRNIYPEINEYLTGTKDPSEQRYLKKETLEIYRIGVGKEKFRNSNDQLSFLDSVYFPLYAPKSKKTKQKKDKQKVEDFGKNQSTLEYEKNQKENAEREINTEEYEMVKMKIRAIGSENKANMRFLPVGSELKGLFGLTSLTKQDKVIVITEGEYDAMAVYQETGLPAISLPNGANHLPVQFIPFLERFERIYLWMDADEVGRIAAEKFSNKLGQMRTIIIDTKMYDENGPKDANDALRRGIDFKKIFQENSRRLGDQNLLTVFDLRDKIVKRIMNYQELTGIQSKYFTFYNRTLKGFRRGEMSILTGATGSGKTTFLSQLSIDFVSQGVPTLWGSFEIKNEILASTMLQQYTRQKLTNESMEKIDQHIEQFGLHPLYFLNFYGSTHIDLLIETLNYAIYNYDIQFICLDNLQFMLSQQAQGTFKFDLQDKVASYLRQLATDKNIHIAVVVHPKKVEDDNNLTVGSIFGTAKITQEADSVLILQKHNVPGLRTIQVKKNRFDGEVGEVSMLYNQENKRYFELTPEEKTSLLLKNGSSQNIIKQRKLKYGDVEPALLKDKVDVKIEKPSKSKTIKNKVSEIAKKDLNFHGKLREHINKKEPEENLINQKNSHIYHTSDNSSTSSGSENEGGEGSKGRSVNSEFTGSMMEITAASEFPEIQVDELKSLVIDDNDLLAPPEDLSVTEIEVEMSMRQERALTQEESSNLRKQYSQEMLNDQSQPITPQQQQAWEVHFKRINEQSLEFKSTERFYYKRYDSLAQVLKTNSFNIDPSNIVGNYDENNEESQNIEEENKQGKSDQGKNLSQQILQNDKQATNTRNFSKKTTYKSSESNMFESKQMQLNKKQSNPSVDYINYRYTQTGIIQDEALREISIKQEEYLELDKILRPKFLKEVKFIESFFKDGRVKSREEVESSSSKRTNYSRAYYEEYQLIQQKNNDDYDPIAIIQDSDNEVEIKSRQGLINEKFDIKHLERSIEIEIQEQIEDDLNREIEQDQDNHNQRMLRSMNEEEKTKRIKELLSKAAK